MNERLKLVVRSLKFLWSRLPFSKSPTVSSSTVDASFVDYRLRAGEHNCALVALAEVMPDISSDAIIQGFSDCCDKWPYAGVTNKEFNITLRHLGRYNQFEYDDSANMVLGDFLANSKRKDIFILLLYGHFAVIKHGKVIDTIFYKRARGDKVYCSWHLLTD